MRLHIHGDFRHRDNRDWIRSLEKRSFVITRLYMYSIGFRRSCNGSNRFQSGGEVDRPPLCPLRPDFPQPTGHLGSTIDVSRGRDGVPRDDHARVYGRKLNRIPD